MKRLTDLGLRKLKPKSGKRYYVMDPTNPGFGVRVGESSTTFIYRYAMHGKKHTMTLGRYPTMKLPRARKLYRDAYEERRSSNDPLVEKRLKEKEAATAKEMTLDAVFKRYCDRWKGIKRSLPENIRTYRHDIQRRLGNRPVNEIRRTDIVELRDRISSAGNTRQSNIVVALLRAIFNEQVEREVIETNPCWQVKKTQEGAPRSLVLTMLELRKVLAMLPATGLHPVTQKVLRMLIYTGQRRAEVCTMEWSDLDLAEGLWHQPAAKNKNQRDNVTPLSDSILSILSEVPHTSGWVFPSPKNEAQHFTADAVTRAIIRKREHFQISKSWTCHDLRRSVATGMKSTLRVPQETVDRILNHTPAALIRTYNVHDYIAEQQRSITKLGSIAR